MSRILSEEEVDALLRGVAEGAIPGGSGARGTRGVQRLDLTSQERNLRGRFAGLELVVDRLVRGLRGSLGAFLGRLPEVRVRAIELLKFARVTARLPRPLALELFRMPPLRGQGMLVIGPSLAATLLEVSFGGAPGRRAASTGRDFSTLEQRVLERVGTRVLHDLREAFRPLAAVEFGGLRSESNPLFALVAAPEDLVLMVELSVGLGDGGEGELSICFPNAALDPLRDRLQAGAPGEGDAPGAGFGDRLRATLAAVELELSVELGSHRMRVQDVLRLAPGDVISLRTGREGPVLVRIEGRARFLGAPGVQGSSNAVRVTARI
jgi:flagellar motor switch protein FliM